MNRKLSISSFVRNYCSEPSENLERYENLIDQSWMSTIYGDLNQYDATPTGFTELEVFKNGFDPNPFFDSDWYLEEYEDVEKAGLDPLWHYVEFGEQEGRRPNPFFDPIFYRARYPDLVEFGGSLLGHFLTYGNSEGRISSCLRTKDSVITAAELAKNDFASAQAYLNGSKVDVVIPVFNGWAFTERCIRAILACIDFDLVNIHIVNDSSTDETLHRLKNYPFINVINTSSNLGFTRACNWAFENLRDSSYIFLLNNDSEPMSGFVVNALTVMQNDESAGIVGSRLLYSNGTLQESGGIVFSDGSAANYGKGKSPDEASYRSTRKVDYCSGAALLIRNSLLNQVSGFDEMYAPAYYEDTDLAFQFRCLGASTYVSSESIVIHHEGKSHGTNPSDEGKSHQSLNAIKFRDKWNLVLGEHYSPGFESVGKAALRLNQKSFSILWIDVDVPEPTRDSGSVRTLALLRIAVGLGYRVVFVPKHGSKSAAAAALRNAGIAVFDSIDEIDDDLKSEFDLVWISRLPMMEEYFSKARIEFPTSKIVFDTVDLHGLRQLREQRIENKPTQVNAARALRQEIGFAQLSDSTVVVSDTELEVLESFNLSSKVRIISNVHEPERILSRFEEAKGLVFIGGFNHAPNVSAIKWFVDSVWPLLPEYIRNDGFTIAGSNMPKDIRDLKTEQIHPIGWAPNSVTTVKQHRLSIAPLTFGAGVKGKVGESFSCGVPVVLTEVAAEGMGIIHEKHALIANTSQEFAASVERLYLDKFLWRSLQASALDLISEKFSIECARREFVALVDGILTQVDSIT